MNFLIDLTTILFVLSVLVFIHESGHYLVAKWCGVRVEVFSLGFGKRLFGFRRGDTDYRVSLLPIGGYVKMAGENPMESRTGDPGEFASHPRWQRFLIAIAGPTVNIIFTIVVLTCLFMVHDEREKFLDEPTVIGDVDPNSPAQKAGFQVGDQILNIQGMANPTWEDVFYKAALNPNQPVDVTIKRGTEVLHKTVVPQLSDSQLGSVGWGPYLGAGIAGVDPGSPAEKAGVRAGDTVSAINGIPVQTFTEFSAKLQESKGSPVELTIERDGHERKVMVAPYYDSAKSKYRVGTVLGPAIRVGRLPFNAAFNKSLATTRSKSLLVFELLQKLIQKKVSIRVLQSPVGMSQETGDAAKRGLPNLVGIMALISLQLGILNLLPIPILDGGMMLMLFIEGIIRRDINQQIKERMYQVAFVALVLFFSVVIYNDVAKSFMHHAP